MFAGETLDPDEDPSFQFESGLLYADIDGQVWYPEESAETARLLDSISGLCGSERAYVVSP